MIISYKWVTVFFFQFMCRHLTLFINQMGALLRVKVATINICAWRIGTVVILGKLGDTVTQLVRSNSESERGEF